MKPPGGRFDRKQEDAIAALLTQRNIEEAAKAAGIGANTLIRWLKVPEFQKAYREAHRAAFSQSIARLQQGTSAAATTLIKLLVDPATPASVKARVADSTAAEPFVDEIQFVSTVDGTITGRLPVRCGVPSARHGRTNPAYLRLPGGGTC